VDNEGYHHLGGAKMKTLYTAAHKANSAASHKGTPAPALKWKARRLVCRLEQDARGNWWLFINSSEHGIPASDVEVSLWLDLQDALKKEKETEF
jgi:hypothetical protein